MLVLTWGVVVGPDLAARIKPAWLLWLADSSWFSLLVRYAIVVAALGLQLLAYHLWLAAGHRRLADVLPGVLLSIVLWLVAARLFGSWLTFSDYSRFYAGLTSIMSALVFFQLSAIIILIGAEPQPRHPGDQGAGPRRQRPLTCVARGTAKAGRVNHARDARVFPSFGDAHASRSALFDPLARGHQRSVRRRTHWARLTSAVWARLPSRGPSR